MKDEDVPVYGTIASQFNDPGTNSLYKAIMDEVVKKTGADLNSIFQITDEMSEKVFVIPPNRTRYLSEIAESNRGYDKWANEQAETAEKLFGLNEAIKLFGGPDMTSPDPSFLGGESVGNPSVSGRSKRQRQTGWSKN